MITESGMKRTRAKIPGLLCLLVLTGILVAGLWPFRRPLNAVTWLEGQNGLRLAGRATLWSSGSFQTTGQPSDESRSLELWVQPSLARASGTILAFSSPKNSGQLLAHQYHSLFILTREIQGDQHRNATIGIEGVFRQAMPVFITVTSGPQKTSIYVDGALNRTFAGTRLAKDFAGRLVIGTSLVDDVTWSGQLRGVAIYGQELAAAQALKHYQTWTTQGHPELSDDERVIALYLFSEHAGNVVHNAVPGGIDLYIPERYALVHQTFLKPFWKEYKFSWSYFGDIVVNIAGLIPLGLVFCAYWSTARPIKHAILITTLLGLAVSLTIEVLQSYLPTRDSGTTDLITNTLGTFLGAKLYDWKVARDLFARIFPG
jgi:VanZ family protein